MWIHKMNHLMDTKIEPVYGFHNLNAKCSEGCLDDLNEQNRVNFNS